MSINTFKVWRCERCDRELGILVLYCVYCIEYHEYISNPIIAERLAEPMTPQEELFKDFFNNEKTLIKDMDTITLRAHREELSKIAFEARARLSAVDDEERQRKPKKGEVTGFSTSLSGDQVSSDAINTIKERQKKLTKEEKILEGLMKLPGIDRKTAEQMMSAGKIKARLDDKEKVEKPKLTSYCATNKHFMCKVDTCECECHKNVKQEEAKPFFNPFKKEN